MFDLSTQLALQMIVYNVDPEGGERGVIIEHFENLANIFSKELIVHQSQNNPIRELMDVEDFIQFLPFEEAVVKASFWDVFFPTNLESLYNFLDEYNQIFIPVL